MKNEKGITLIVLVITIIVLLIIVGISIGSGKEEIKDAKKNKLLSELDMVQHAILERYTKYSLTKDQNLLVGNVLDETSLIEIEKKMGIELQDEEHPENYYKLTKEELKQLGIKNTEDTYIVNYKTGEVINETSQKTYDNKPLYKYSLKNEK